MPVFWFVFLNFALIICSVNKSTRYYLMLIFNGTTVYVSFVSDIQLNSSTTQSTLPSSTSTSYVGITTSSDPQISSGVTIPTETTSLNNTDETSSSALTSSVVTNTTSLSEAPVTLSSTHLSSDQSNGTSEMEQQLLLVPILELRLMSTILPSQPAIMLILDM